MTYSDSMQFSDPKTYKILFISSYGLKDMIYKSSKHFLGIFRKLRKEEAFPYRASSSLRE
jgi:hypothetical protein